MTAPMPVAWIQGQGSVGADNLNTFTQNVASVAQLQNFVGLPTMGIQLLGFTTPDDGGQGFFYWATGTFTNDGVNTIVPTGASSGAWIRLTINGIVQVAPLVTATGTTILKNQQYIPIDNTTGAAFGISLPTAPVNGETHTIKDWLGNASTYNITVFGNGNNIDGNAGFTMTSNYQSANFMFAWNKWGVW